MARSKKIELVLTDGKPEGIITAEIDFWNAKIIKIPRKYVKDCNIKDLEFAGVYFLFCKNDEGKDRVYIGEGENVKTRLEQHLSDYTGEECEEGKNVKQTLKNNFWLTAITITSEELHKTLIQYLESEFIRIVKECNVYELLNQNNGLNPSIPEYNLDSMKDFIDNAEIIFPSLGYKVLEPLVDKELKQEVNNSENLFIGSNTTKYKGEATTNSNGFMLFKGAKLDPSVAPSAPDYVIDLRDEHSGKIKNFITIEDIPFDNPRQAACFLTGSSVNALDYWKNKNGKTLKELRDQDL